MTLLMGSVFILSFHFSDENGATTTGQSHVYAAPVHRRFDEPSSSRWLRGDLFSHYTMSTPQISVNPGGESFRTAAERSISIREDLASQRCDLAHSDSARVFSDIYEHGVWSPGSRLSLSDITPRMFYNYGNPFGTSQRPSLSGVGSVVGEATKSPIEFLSSLISEYGVNSVLDIPCGDVN